MRGKTQIMRDSLLVSDDLATQIRGFIHIQNAIDQCDPETRALVHDMIEIYDSEDATPDEKRAALYTIQDALFPRLAEDFGEEERRLMNSPKVIAAKKELDEQEATFAERLQRAMAQTGMTQESLTEKTGVSQPAISLMLSRQLRPQMRTIHKFAEALDVSPDQLWPQ